MGVKGALTIFDYAGIACSPFPPGSADERQIFQDFNRLSYVDLHSMCTDSHWKLDHKTRHTIRLGSK